MLYYIRKRNTNAFTLLELLLAIVLTAIIILTATAAVRGLSRNRFTVEQNDRVFSQAMFFMDLLTRDLANVVSVGDDQAVIRIIPGDSDSGPCDRIVIFRNADLLTSSNLAPYAEVEYGMLFNGSIADCLGRRLAPVKDLSSGNSKGRLFVLSDPVKSLKFEIYDGSSWVRAPIDNDTKPLMIRVTLETPIALWAQDKPFIIRQIPVYPYIMNIKNETDFNEN